LEAALHGLRNPGQQQHPPAYLLKRAQVETKAQPQQDHHQRHLAQLAAEGQQRQDQQLSQSKPTLGLPSPGWMNGLAGGGA
jgi:hypothetical protein